jgi:plasmid stabilization system protein ParE
MAKVLITGPAKRDIQESYDWWSGNRSAEQSNRWYVGIHAAVKSLQQHPERCSIALENDLLAQGVRQLLYGLSRRPTHRIVFTIDGDKVVVLRVRHVSQDVLTGADIGI